MIKTKVGSIGVLCCKGSGDPPISEEGFCRRLSHSAPKYGITVFAFRPEDVSEDMATVKGYFYKQGQWSSAEVAFPDLIYDRSLFRKRSELKEAASLISMATKRKQSILWSRGLPGKWHVYQVLKRNSAIAPFLPPTHRYQGKEKLTKYLHIYDNKVFLKPQGGSQGKNTLLVQLHPADGSLRIKGRSKDNLPFHHIFTEGDQGLEWIERFTKNRAYLIQPFLHLYNHENSPFDIRVLMQKNERGLWMLTGMALRKGQRGRITSNLHGGGRALSVQPFLSEQFGASRANHMIDVLRHLSVDIPPILESRYGRLGELGIDFGIDRKGEIWLLEVNSKPGRTSFRQAGDPGSAILALENPLRYARYLLLRQLRRVNS